KKGKVYESTEKYSVLRANRAIERSDVVLMDINGEEGILEQDKRIAGLAHDEGRAVIIVVNKWDAVEKDDKTMKKFEDNISTEFKFFDYAPIGFLSAVKKSRLKTLFPMIRLVNDVDKKRIQSCTLN